jgi:hypothetical protein
VLLSQSKGYDESGTNSLNEWRDMGPVDLVLCPSSIGLTCGELSGMNAHCASEDHEDLRA